MFSFVELEDGSFRLVIEMQSEGIRYSEVTRFEKVTDDPDLKEKEDGYKLEVE